MTATANVTQPTGGPTADGDATTSTDPTLASLLERLDVSEHFLHSRLERVPVRGAGAPQVRPQVRPHQSHSLTADGLDELLHSLTVVGQLQPIIVEEHPHGERVLLAGQRRLHALAFADANRVASPHLDGTALALVVDGPLDEWSRSAVQLAENLARTDLTRTELGRALWMARWRLLYERIRVVGGDPPDGSDEVNPADRCMQLLAWRDDRPELHNVGANWADTATALGLNLSEAQAKQIARQYRDIGERLSERLDAHGASHRARQQARDVSVGAGSDEAVSEILDAVEAREEPADSKLIESALRAKHDDPALDGAAAVDQAAAGAAESAPAADGDTSAADGQPPSSSDGGAPNVANTADDSGGHPEVAAPSATSAAELIAELRTVENQLLGSVAAKFDELDEAVEDGGHIDPRDLATLRLLSESLLNTAERVAALDPTGDTA